MRPEDFEPVPFDISSGENSGKPAFIEEKKRIICEFIG